MRTANALPQARITVDIRKQRRYDLLQQRRQVHARSRVLVMHGQVDLANLLLPQHCFGGRPQQPLSGGGRADRLPQTRQKSCRNGKVLRQRITHAFAIESARHRRKDRLIQQPVEAAGTIERHRQVALIFENRPHQRIHRGRRKRRQIGIQNHAGIRAQRLCLRQQRRIDGRLPQPRRGRAGNRRNLPRHQPHIARCIRRLR